MSRPSFHLYLWRHRVLYVGVSPENTLHRHHAAQLCVGLEAPIQARPVDSDDWLSATAVLIPPDHDHQIDAGSGRILALYWEPEADDYPFPTASAALAPFSVQAKAFQQLTALVDGNADANDIWDACERALNVRSRRPANEPDQRVQRVIEHIRNAPEADHGVDTLAAFVHLSPSRLSHIFKANVGVPIRQFVLWARARAVVTLAVNGASLTEAAHATGFSDAAHMSNAFRRMFGFAPSALFAQNLKKSVVISD